MTSKKKGRKKTHRLQTRRLVFNTDTNFDKELFLEFGLDIIGNCDVNLESRLNRLSIQISGNPDVIDRISNRLIILEKQLSRAISPSFDGYYYYENEILAKLFPNQLQLKYFVSSIQVKGYEAFIQNSNTLATNAPFKELQDIHRLSVVALDKAPSMQNKDIQKFLSIFSMRTGESHEVIANIAMKNNIISERDAIYHFAMDVNDAYDKMTNKIKDYNIDEIIESFNDPLDDISVFEGGKIVIIKDGKIIPDSEL